MSYLSSWAVIAILISILTTTHAAEQCSNLTAPRVYVPNGDFSSGRIAPWTDFVPVPENISATIRRPGYRSRYAAKIHLPSINYDEEDSDIPITSGNLRQLIVQPLGANACYKATVAINWLRYSAPNKDQPTCTFALYILGLGLIIEQAPQKPGWHELSFYATTYRDLEAWEPRLELICGTDEENTTPEVTLLVDHVKVKTLRHPPPPGTEIQFDSSP